MSEPILVARLILAWNESKVPAHRFRAMKAVRIVDECNDCFRGADANTGDASQLNDGGRLLSPMVQLLFDTSHLPGVFLHDASRLCRFIR